MIKLLALDLDGTLLNSQGKIPKENKIAIAKAEEKGVFGELKYIIGKLDYND